MQVAPGFLVEYFQDKKILCGLCVKVDKKGLHLLTEEKREASIPAQRAMLAAPSRFPPDHPREEVVAFLREEAARRERMKDDIALEDLWELLADEPGQYTVRELAGTWFSGALSDEQVSAMLRALRDDRIYFERKNDLFVPHTRERATQIRESVLAEERKEREREEMGRWLQTVWLRGSPPPNGKPDCLDRYLDWFREAAIHGQESSRFKEVQTLLQRAGISQNDAPFQVLVKAGVWDVDENLLLYKNHVPIEFPRDVTGLAEDITERIEVEGVAAWLSSREDLRHLHAITIDDEHTVETDDALSVERIEGGWRVGVHIADPAELVVPGSALDREALHRGTSIYFPDMKIPMMPPSLGTRACSLTAGLDRLAMSVLADLDDEGNLLSTRIVESVIRVRERLTYDDVDEALGQREDLDTLHRLADARRLRRKSSGAVFVPFPSVEVHVWHEEGGRRIEVRREEHDIPSHVLVSEFMILANEAVATFCKDNQIPAIYRGQQEPAEPIEIGDTFTALDGFRIRRLLRKGGISLEPVRHSGLGLDAYLQFTSPIRRYVDLTMHRQIKSFLRDGTPLHTKEDLEKITAITTGQAEQAEQLERARKAYWIYKHLEEDRWASRKATILQVFPDRWHVQLYDTLLETDCPSSGRTVAAGEEIEVKIELVWPREGVLRVSCATPGAPARSRR